MNKPDRTWHVIINGEPQSGTPQAQCYDERVALAFPEGPPAGPDVRISVTYSHGKDTGTVKPGGSLQVENGMMIDVTPAYQS